MTYPHGKPNDEGTTHNVCAEKLKEFGADAPCCTCSHHWCDSDFSGTAEITGHGPSEETKMVLVEILNKMQGLKTVREARTLIKWYFLGKPK